MTDKDKGKDKHATTDRAGTAPGRDATREDPMTSFDPKAEPPPAPAQEAEPSAPAERTGVGNGSARTAQVPPEAGADAAAAEAQAAPAESSAEAAPQGAEAPAAESEPAEPEEPDLAAQLDQARQDAAAHFDRFVRLQAEFENYKKRIQKEHAETLRYALTPLVTEVAAIMDNLERAADHARKEQADAAAALLAGIEMVIRQMQEALERFGVKRIAAVGQPFDPALHEAMTVVERDDVPDNQVLDEFQAGYLLHDRVVRPARVSVSKRSGEAGAEAPPGD